MKKNDLRILISAEEIRRRVSELGDSISKDYGNRDLVIVGVLKGAFVFLADLVRAVSAPLHCEFLRVSSYEGRRSSGDVRVDFDLTQPVSGKHVLLVEDIVDTGRTLRFLLEHLKGKGAASIKVCALLYKEIEPSVRPLIDYLGFTVPDEYVIGYGMDDSGRYRELPYVGVAKKSSF